MATGNESDGRDSVDGVRIGREGRVGHLTLVRPEAINALNLTMVRALAATLTRWRDDRCVELVLLDGIGRRGFCAGGDIKFVHANAAAHPERVREFWREEYQLDAVLASYPKPVVTVAHRHLDEGRRRPSQPCLPPHRHPFGAAGDAGDADRFVSRCWRATPVGPRTRAVGNARCADGGCLRQWGRRCDGLRRCRCRRRAAR